MTTTIRAILIDPHARCVESVQIRPDDVEQMNSIIGSQTFTSVSLSPRQVMFLDDDGWLDSAGRVSVRPGQAYFWLARYPQLLAGRGLIVGIGREGESVDTPLPVDFVRGLTRWEDNPGAHVPPPPTITVWGV